MPPAGPGREICRAPWLTLVAVIAQLAALLIVHQLAAARHLGDHRRGRVAVYGARFGAWLLGPTVGVVIAACLLGLGSNAWARLTTRPAAVPLVPGLAALVPGRSGFRGISAFLRQATGSLQILAAVLVIAAGLVVGLLVADAHSPPGGRSGAIEGAHGLVHAPRPCVHAARLQDPVDVLAIVRLQQLLERGLGQGSSCSAICRSCGTAVSGRGSPLKPAGARRSRRLLLRQAVQLAEVEDLDELVVAAHAEHAAALEPVEGAAERLRHGPEARGQLALARRQLDDAGRRARRLAGRRPPSAGGSSCASASASR